MSVTLARKEIIHLKEYQSARSLVTRGSIFLDANEAPLSSLVPPVNRYPEPQPRALVERLCCLYQVPQDQLVIGRGSDEAIDLLVRVFCEAGKDQILICPPTYGMYEVSANTQGAQIMRVPTLLEGEHCSLDEAAILNAIRNQNQNSPIKIIFICSPNNPTATPFSKSVITRICKASLNQCMVVVDEAYAEFSEEESLIQNIHEFSNLVVLRTLSKAWAGAGIRMGVALAQAPIIQLLQKVRAPYPLSLPAIEAALQLTDEKRQVELKARVQTITAERSRMIHALKQIKGVDFVYPSATNFILARFQQHARILSETRNAGIILRDRNSEKGLENCIRITIGTADENNQVLKIIREVLA